MGVRAGPPETVASSTEGAGHNRVGRGRVQHLALSPVTGFPAQAPGPHPVNWTPSL